MIRTTTAIALLIGLVMGCSSLKIKDPMQAFDKANRAYRQAISWSEYVVAATFLKNEDEEKVAGQIEHLNNFRVTAYEPRVMTVIEDGVRVRQVVKISYFRKNDLVVSAIADEQLWEYDRQKNTWLLLTGFPKLK
jgi:hypothetical protein